MAECVAQKFGDERWIAACWCKLRKYIRDSLQSSVVDYQLFIRFPSTSAHLLQRFQRFTSILKVLVQSHVLASACFNQHDLDPWDAKAASQTNQLWHQDRNEDYCTLRSDNGVKSILQQDCRLASNAI